MKRIIATVLLAVVFVLGLLNVGATWSGYDSGVAHAARVVRPCDPGLDAPDPF